jgi:hypothetical protein
MFRCTIFNHDYTFGTPTGQVATTPVRVTQVGTVLVKGPAPRQAAAQAYVRCVGRQRARLLRQQRQAPRHIAAQEANLGQIAASLRKTKSRIGECYQFDNLVEAWLIMVEPMPSVPCPTPSRSLSSRRKRLLHLLQSPSPN